MSDVSESPCAAEAHADTLTLDSVIASLIGCSDSTTLLQRITETLIERTRAQAAFVSIRNETGETLDCIAESGARSETLLACRRAPDQGLIGRAWTSAATVFAADANNQGSTFQFAASTQVCCVPLIHDAEVLGVVTMTCNDTSIRLSDDIPLLERIARMASIAIANTHLVESTRRSLERTRALGDVSRELNVLADFKDACDVVSRMLLTALDVSWCCCYLLDEHGALQPSVSWRMIDNQPQPYPVCSVDLAEAGITRWCVDNASAADLKRDSMDARESAQARRLRSELDIGSCSCAPLSQNGEIIGAMIVARERNRCDIEDSNVQAFRTAVNQLCSALERYALADQLHHQAYHDSMTGLHNRRSLELELAQAIDHAGPAGQRAAVLFLDLDGFKDINDSHGHAIGDRLLQVIADQLTQALGGDGLLARMGGDEFAVLLTDLPESTSAMRIARRLEAAFGVEVDIDGLLLRVGTSIGLCRFPEDGTTATDLLRHADMAMYRAKRDSRGSVCSFCPDLAAEAFERSNLALDLGCALERREFQLAYQPQVRCSDGRVTGVEALLRWNHPIRGNVSPAMFIPVAEQTGLIREIGDWVLDESMRQIAEWADGPLQDLRVSVNIAAPQFQQSGFADRVIEGLARTGAPASKLELEVTESVVMQDVNEVVQILQRLRDAGVRVAIDDFGTGYSSLRYLQDLPLDVLKIDRAFVAHVREGRLDQSMVKSIQMLATGLDLETVAEGVETDEQREAVEGIGCDTIQGYLYSRPVSAEELNEAVRSIDELAPSHMPIKRAA